MSKFDMETITCPECKTEQKIKRWESIEAQDSPQAKEDIINGNLFKFECKKCKKEVPLVYKCLYTDQKKKLSIWLLPDGEDVKNEKSCEGWIKRIVATPNELKEKVMINDKGMDDRVVELLKMLYTAQLPKLLDNEKIGEEGILEMFIDFIEEDKYGFVIFFENIEPIMVPIDYDIYINLYKDLIEKIEENQRERFIRVDFQWSKEFFTLLNDEKTTNN